ncbi:MAG: hypothetical protein HZB65_04245 [Candidatus Aenigmarchaeota archaeon]|nr:hypothetical protein [Candidatus Aenigmarchaeota archaeon]
MTLVNEKIKEIELIFRKFFGYDIGQTKRIVAKIKTEEDLVEIFEGAKNIFEKNGKGVNKNFFGRYYTILNGKLTTDSSWNKFKKNVLECIYSDQGVMIKDLIEFFIEKSNTGELPIDFTVLKARFPKVRNPLDRLIGYNIIERIDKSGAIAYSFYEETIPLIKEIINSEYVKSKSPVALSSDAAAEELEEIKKMDMEFETYLKDLVENRLEETIKFGEYLTVNFIADYIKKMFGNVLYFDSVLGITHQYALSDATVFNAEGTIAMKTGFNLAFFGAPGTGKTFAVDDMIRGDPRKGVAPHGLPGRNRYCGGITPVRFISIGEAYQGRKFNFIIPEFNDWFKYKGMVEPLKLAMEQREIRYEKMGGTVGPYKFNSFFATNYNTKTLDKGYKVTVSDPNFNAIEDRMLCSLHKMTKERFNAIVQSQKSLALGKIKMEYALKIRDHATLVYAIMTRHELLKEKFPQKNVLLTEELYKEIEKARELILEEIQEKFKLIPFSSRLERRALQLACAMSLLSYFSTKNKEHIEITKDALKFATKFFVEEAVVRSQEKIDQKRILKKLNIDY